MASSLSVTNFNNYKGGAWMINVKFDGDGVRCSIAGSSREIYAELTVFFKSLIEDKRTCELLVDVLEEVIPKND